MYFVFLIQKEAHSFVSGTVGFSLLHKELWPCPTQLPLGAFTLELHHVPEQAALSHQRLRGALLRHLSVLQHHDVIRPGHGAHPVGDDQHQIGRASCRERV